MDDYQPFNRINVNKGGQSTTFKDNNQNITNTKVIANKFCEYFSQIGHTLASSIPNPSIPFGNYLNKTKITNPT